MPSHTVRELIFKRRDRENSILQELADIHCHVIPYVDDGAVNMEEALAILRMQRDQGVRVVCATPHLRKGMFETPDEDIIRHFKELKIRAKEEGIDMLFALSREYHADALFEEKLENKEIIPMGAGNVILTEFSHAHTMRQIRGTLELIRMKGYRPLIAHIERYPALYGDLDKVQRLKDNGALVQVNAGAILGRGGSKQEAWTKKLLKNRLADVIGSDAHGTDFRPPELLECANYVGKKYGEEYANRIFYSNPLKILMKP